MQFKKPNMYGVLRSSALSGSVIALLLLPISTQAFNPNEGEDSASPGATLKPKGATKPIAPSQRITLPSTELLFAPIPAVTPILRAPIAAVEPPPAKETPALTASSASQPQVTEPVASPPQETVATAAAPVPEVPAPQPYAVVTIPQEPAPPASPVVMAETPITAAQAALIVTAAGGTASAPAAPPVDEATQAKAQAILAQEPAPVQLASVEPLPPAELPSAEAQAARVSVAPPTRFAASASAPALPPPPSPSFAPAALPENTAPVATAEPAKIAATPVIAPVPAVPAPAKELSDTSRRVLSKFPSKIDSKQASKKGKQKLTIARMTPDAKSLTADGKKIESFDATGLSIRVQRPGLDTNFELNRAYTALMGGDSDTAITTYKNILSAEPTNEDALFGLAATYHRRGDIEQARPYYAQLLKINPNHRDALNNYLALVSDEAPEDSLAELERLEQRNPDFSPIPAQQALVLTKLGYPERARDKMLRAIELSPDNLTYKYNLAIMFDQQGDRENAAPLYHLLIDAAMNGEKIPASTESLQKRLNYISVVTPSESIKGS